MKQLLLLLLIAFLPACASIPKPNYPAWGRVDNRAESASLVALIARPEAYADRPVRVIGAFRLEFEGDAICLHSEDLAKRVSDNCLWMSLDMVALGTSRAELEKLNGKHVLLEGIFSAEHRGHFGMYPGAIRDIWRVSEWPGYN